MFGVLVNGVTAALGAMLGSVVRKGLPKKYTDAVMAILALCTLIMGIQGAVKTENMLLMLASILIGGIVGTALGVEDGMKRLGLAMKNRFIKKDDATSMEGLITLSILQITGAMAILGPIQAAFGSDDLLLFKSVLDTISAFIFGSIYGASVAFAGACVIIYEGFFFFLAVLIMPIMTPEVINELNAVGNLLLVALAMNMLNLTKIKVADLLPAMCIPIVYYIAMA